MSENQDSALSKALNWVIEVDVPAIKGSVDGLKSSNPGLSKEELANTIFSKAQWKSAASGLVTGLPSNWATMILAAIGDVAITLRLEVIATAKVALLYQPNFFSNDEAAWELLVPIFGFNAISQVMQEAAIKGGQGLSKAAIKKYLSKETLAQFKKIMLKLFGKKVTQKGIITKTLPIVGGMIGAVWNWAEVSIIKKRAIKYFAS